MIDLNICFYSNCLLTYLHIKDFLPCAGLFYNGTTGKLTCFNITEEYVECSDATGCGTGPAALSWDFQVCSQLMCPLPSPSLLPLFFPKFSPYLLLPHSLPPLSLLSLISLPTSFSLIPSLPPLHSYIHLQACTETTLPCSTNNITDMFPPFTYNPSAHCQRTWGVEQRPEWIKTEYWGKGSMFLL